MGYQPPLQTASFAACGGNYHFLLALTPLISLCRSSCVDSLIIDWLSSSPWTAATSRMTWRRRTRQGGGTSYPRTHDTYGRTHYTLRLRQTVQSQAVGPQPHTRSVHRAECPCSVCPPVHTPGEGGRASKSSENASRARASADTVTRARARVKCQVSSDA